METMQQPCNQQRTEEDGLAKPCSEHWLTEETEGRMQNEDVTLNPFSFAPQVIHLHKDHDLFEDGDIHRHMYLQDIYILDTDDKPSLSVSEFACHISGCSAVFTSLEEYEHHYNSLHRHVCCSCRRSLPSARLLDIHIQEWHDSLFMILAQNQDMYQCLVEGCGQKFRTSKDRKTHLIEIHKYPPDFRFDKSKKEKGRGSEVKKQKHKETAMEVVDDVCESEGVCEVLTHVASDQPEQEESMESEEQTTHMEKSASAGGHADLSAGAPGTECTSAESQKPRYSYRLV